MQVEQKKKQHKIKKQNEKKRGEMKMIKLEGRVRMFQKREINKEIEIMIIIWLTMMMIMMMR